MQGTLSHTMLGQLTAIQSVITFHFASIKAFMFTVICTVQQHILQLWFCSDCAHSGELLLEDNLGASQHFSMLFCITFSSAV